MNWLEFFASVVESLAWPAVAVIVVALFRRELTKLADKVREFEYGGLKLSFQERLNEIQQRAEEAGLPPPQPAPPIPEAPPPVPAPGVNQLALLAAISPRAAVIDAWRRVEQAATELFVRTGQSIPRLSAMRQALEAAGLPAETVSLFDDLRALRNQAAHHSDFAIESTQALEYALLAQRVEAAIARLHRGQQ